MAGGQTMGQRKSSSHEEGWEPSRQGASAAGAHLFLQITDHCFAVPVGAVERVFRAVDVTPSPDLQPPYLGMIVYRGEVLPVLDGASFVGRKTETVDPDQQMVLLRHQAEKWVLLVDRVLEVRDGGTEGAAAARKDKDEDKAQGFYDEQFGFVGLLPISRPVRGEAGCRV